MEYPLTWLLGAIRIRSFMRLNPYSNGIPSDNIIKYEKDYWFSVLILILMEYPLTSSV